MHSTYTQRKQAYVHADTHTHTLVYAIKNQTKQINWQQQQQQLKPAKVARTRTTAPTTSKTAFIQNIFD